MTRLIAFTAAALAASVSVGLLETAPAYAATGEACEVMPTEIRTAAADADQRAQRKALSRLAVGEALCDAGNERAAKKKFRQAVKALGLEKEQFAAL